MSSPQTIRAILLASASITSMRDLRASICSSHEPFSALRLAAFYVRGAADDEQKLSVRSPIFEIAPSFCLPPVGGTGIDAVYGETGYMFGDSQGGNDRVGGGAGDDLVYGDAAQMNETAEAAMRAFFARNGQD